jgi:predicted histidine transporter YuiF (NhaC family)
MTYALIELFGMIIGVLAGVVVTHIHRDYRETKAKLDELTAVKTRSQQTGATMAGLEDAMAALISLQYNRNIEQERIDAALRMLQQLRKGPYEYEPKPTGERKEFI